MCAGHQKEYALIVTFLVMVVRVKPLDADGNVSPPFWSFLGGGAGGVAGTFAGVNSPGLCAVKKR